MDKIDARTLPQEVLEHLRRQAFLLREKGYTWAHIAEVCGVNIWTVMNWSRRAREEGMETVDSVSAGIVEAKIHVAAKL